MSRWQKIIVVVGFIAVVFGVGFLLYVIFFRPLVPTADNANQLTNNAALPGANNGVGGQLAPGGNGSLPQANNANGQPSANNANGQTPPVTATASGGLTETTGLTTIPVAGAALGSDNRVYYYDPATGRFYSIDANGNTKALTDRVFHQVQNIVWSPQHDKAVLEYPDGANVVYDFATRQQVTLPAHWKNFDFSPSGDRLVAKNIGLNPENNFLIVTDASGSRSQIIRELGSNETSVIAEWSPNNIMVGMYLGDADLDTQEVFFIGQNNENFKSMTVEGWGFTSQWSPQGDTLLYSVHNTLSQDKPELWIVDAMAGTIGQNRKQIRLQTWADKCTFYDNTTVYCAVPTVLEKGAGYFPEEMDASPDTIYKINLTSGSKNVVAQPASDHTIRSLIISEDGKYLYFTDKFDGRLYKIQLR